MSNVNNLQSLVIDEADRMIQEGHYQELSYLIDKINSSCKFLRHFNREKRKGLKNLSQPVHLFVIFGFNAPIFVEDFVFCISYLSPAS